MNYNANDNLEIMKFAKNYNCFLINLVVNEIIKSNAKYIADFGCADGFFIKEISKKINTKCSFVGIEKDKTSISICKEKNINITTELNNINKQDIIYSFNVLEHIEDDLKILQEFYSKLHNNGKLILFLPAFNFLFTSMDKKTGHFRRYKKKEIRKKLNDCGFKIERIEYFDILGAILTIIYKLLDNFIQQNGNITKKQILFFDKLFKINYFITKFFFKKLFGKNLVIVAKK